MSGKSEIEAIRAVKRWKIHSEVDGHDITPFRRETDGIWDDEVVLASDYLSHIDALEARVARLEGALNEGKQSRNDECRLRQGAEALYVEMLERLGAAQARVRELTLDMEHFDAAVDRVANLEAAIKTVLSGTCVNWPDTLRSALAAGKGE